MEKFDDLYGILRLSALKWRHNKNVDEDEELFEKKEQYNLTLSGKNAIVTEI